MRLDAAAAAAARPPGGMAEMTDLRAGARVGAMDTGRGSSGPVREACGTVNSWRGVCPNSAICCCSAEMRAGSVIVSMSTAPSYVR